MARRRIGQEQVAVGIAQVSKRSSLDELAALVDWASLDSLLAGISSSAKGEPGWPPLALFSALLLTTWHDLSDVCLWSWWGGPRPAERQWTRWTSLRLAHLPMCNSTEISIHLLHHRTSSVPGNPALRP